MFPERWNVEICDVTLRDGEQTPGISFTCDEKMKIAGMLDQVGVDVIEAGFPTVSPEEKRCVTAISRMDLDARICCLARARPEDVEAAAAAEVDMVSLFIATSDLHIKHKYKKPREVVLAGALDMIDLARDHGLAVRFAAEDASRTDPAFLKEVYRAGGDRGADLVSFADTVGCLTPLEMYAVMSDLCSTVSVPLCAHCHNDMGCATANTITAAAAGAFQLHTTVNGIGERAGNASLEEVLVLLNLKGGVVRYDLSHLGELSAQVSTSSGLPVPKNKPVVGDLVFSHESGIHIAAMLEDPATYEYLPPALVGRERQFILGKHSGTKALRHITASLGHPLTDPQIARMLTLIKERSEHKCSITPTVLTELIHLVEEGKA
jgi:methanogen homocitrate synthase